MILGLVALQALLAQASFKIDDLQTRVDQLTQTTRQKTVTVARLGSPARITREAHNIGMVVSPGGVQVLHVRDASPAKHQVDQQRAVVGVRP